jgi:hypothetical protein
MTWKAFLSSKLRERSISNRAVYISVFVAFFVGWVVG